MKNYLITLLTTLFFLSSCKKDKTPATITGTLKNTPNLIALGFKPGEPFALNIFHIYDLNHDNNADKKYIRVAMYSDDSARILEEPKPIDSISSGWPADVKKVQWSPGAQFIVNNTFFLEINGGQFRKIMYNQASPQHIWLTKHNSIPGINVLPNAEVNVTGGSLYTDWKLIYFQLKSATTYNGLSFQLVDYATAFGQAFNAYTNWEDVSNVIYVRTSGVSAWPTFYFFDFKNWRYWKIDKSQGLLGDWIGHPVKSLDRFLKWPDGWGKQ
jgi:hypothetical protein